MQMELQLTQMEDSVIPESNTSDTLKFRENLGKPIITSFYAYLEQ